MVYVEDAVEDGVRWRKSGFCGGGGMRMEWRFE